MIFPGSAVILLVSPEPWSSHFVSKHHYAITLAKTGSTVLFLNPPNDSLKDFVVDKVPDTDNLYIISAPMVAVGLRYYPRWLRKFIEKRWLARLEMKINRVITTVWLFENSRFFDMSFAGDRLKIYHQVDMNQNFNVADAASTADICFCTTDFIKQKLSPSNQRTYKIQHGVSIYDDNPTIPAELVKHFTHGSLHVAYTGNLDIPYLDTPLLLNLVQNFPDICFHFIGQYNADNKLYQSCKNFNNITWYGLIDNKYIPEMLILCDVLLITYLAAQYKEQLANPHKLMEYLASGKTVVATYTDEFKDKRQLLEMVDDSNDFITTFKHVIDNLDEYNSPEKQAMRIEYAQQHSYEKQLEKIFGYLEKHGLIEGTNQNAG